MEFLHNLNQVSVNFTCYNTQMKKIILSLTLLFFVWNSAHAGDYFAVGIDCFKKGDYQRAAKSLETAVRINPLNVNARYYLAQAYIKQKKIAEAQDQYNRIIILAPSSDASKLSEKGLSLIRQSFASNIDTSALSNDDLSRYKNNYLEYVFPPGDELKKWASFPVKVYVEPKKYKTICQKAFMQWQERSAKIVSFAFVPTPQEAQIILTFRDKLENSSTESSYIAGVSKPYYKGNNIEKSEIKILTIDPNTRAELEDSFIYFATLHEIGHSLGMKGHSPDTNDVMFAQSEKSKTELTQRDLNTISLFYKIDKKTLASKKKSGYDVQLQQAIDYANSTPTKAIGWANLGDAYKNKEMYSDAIKSYKKALAIEPQDPQINSLIGYAYQMMGDKQNAFSSYKKACDLDKSNSLYLYQFANIALESGQKTIGQVYIDKFIQADPKSIFDERIQAIKSLYSQ